jgi:hypothetical protein
MMTTVFTPRQQTHLHAEISAGWFLLAVFLGVLLVCASSRSVAER